MSSELRKLWEHAGGRLPDDWAIVSLESLLRDTKSIAVGVMYPGPDTPGGVPLLKVGDIKDGSVPKKPSYRISAETDEEHKRTKLVGDELLITLVGNPGECVVVTPEMAGWNPARAIAVVRLHDTSLRTYLKTVLESTAGRHLIDAVLNTTVQKTLNLKDIRRLPIPLPSRATIKSISSFSEALTMRITLLRKTNATLEAIAQALFKSWFVDFDAVHAKAAGLEPEGMDAATAALFPDSFEESELGLVPIGWRLGCVGDIAVQKKGSVTPLASPHERFEHYSLPAFDSSQSPVQELGGSIKSNKTPLPEEAVLLSKLNPHIPRVWLPVKHGGNAVCSTEFLAYSPRGAGSKELIYCLFSSAEFQQQLCQLVTGTSNSHQRVKPDQILKIRLAIANDSLFTAFAGITAPIFERIYENRLKAQILTQLRDTLLPRLISGQLHFPKTEMMVDAAYRQEEINS